MGKRLSSSTGTSINFGTSINCSSKILKRHYTNIDPLHDNGINSFQNLGYSLWQSSKKKSSGKKCTNLNKSNNSKRCNSPLNP